MRIATYLRDDAPAVGIVEGDSILDLDAAFAGASAGEAPESVLALIEAGPSLLERVRSIASGIERHDGAWKPLDSVRLLAPIPRPRKNVFNVGRNYRLHIEEGARARGFEATFPTVPEFFTKPPTAVIGHEADVHYFSRITSQLDYEVELMIVIGKQCRDLRPDEVDSVVFGYTIGNDVTARDLQRSHGQWFKGKALDTSLPIGPWIVTADAFGDPAAHTLKLRINGEERQNSTISDMLFDCRAIVASLSAGLTLEPGDMICTGTPSGVGMGLVPQAFLKDGDVIECEIDGIGILRNRVVEAK